MLSRRDPADGTTGATWRTYRFVCDLRGSVRLVVCHETEEVVQRLACDAWGNVVEEEDDAYDAATGVSFQPFGYAGGLRDRLTGLVRFGARDYDPSTGRWTAKYPSGFAGGYNLYLYAAGDPVNLIDMTGESPIAAHLAAKAAVAGIAALTYGVIDFFA